MDPIVHGEVDFMNPFLALTSEETITDGLVREFTSAKNLPAEEIKNAAHAAWEELATCRQDIRKKVKKLSLTWKDRNPRHRACRSSIPLRS